MSALIHESKSVQWPVGAPGWCDKVRMQSTLTEILDEIRPATLGKGDQLIHGALMVALIRGILAGQLRWVYDTLGKLLGLSRPESVARTPDGKSLPAREVECPQCGAHFVPKAPPPRTPAR